MDDRRKTKKELIGDLEVLRRQAAALEEAEGALRESDERYRSVLAGIEDGYYETDLQGSLTFCNDAMAHEVLRLPKEAVTGMSYREWVDEESAKPVYQAFNQVYRTGNPIKAVRYKLTRNDGSECMVETSASLIRDETGRAIGFRGIIRDATERIQAEEALRESEERYRLLLAASPDPITVYDHQGKVVYVNPAFEQTFGWTREELAGKGIDFVPPHEMERTKEAVARTLKGESVLLESQRLTKDGRLLDIQLKTAIFTDNEGRLAGDIVIYRDITARKQAENALKRHRDHLEELVEERTGDLKDMNAQLQKEIEERIHTEKALVEAEARYRRLYEESKKAEELYRSLFNSSADAIAVYDLAGGARYLNPAFTQIFGWTLEDMHCRLIPFVPDSEKDITRRQIEEVIQGGLTRRNFETKRLTKDGRLLEVNISASRYDDHEGRPAGTLSILRDVTDKVKMESELRQARNYLQNVIDSMPSVLIGVDGDERVTHWNEQARRVTGRSFGEVQGRPLADVFPMSKAQVEMVRDCIRGGEPKEVEKLQTVNHGDVRYIHMVVYPLAAETVVGAAIRLDDVTDRARIEEMMVQTEKMMSVGGLAAGMAHEINNPLGGVIQGAQNILRRLSPDIPANTAAARDCGTEMEKIRAYMEKRQITALIEGIHSSGKRAARIVTNMLEFSRHSKSEMRPARLGELLDKAVELAASDYDLKKQYDFRHIEIVRDYDADLPPIHCDPTKIEQVVLNLLKNAAQAMADIRDANGKPLCIKLRTCLDGPYARIEVEDNGPGMEEKIRKRVFEPFFTTKNVGAGTGLGLSVSYFIIADNHQGRLSVDSTPGEGARFIIHLPLEKRRRDRSHDRRRSR